MDYGFKKPYNRVCKQFIEGKCFNDDCEFSHTIPNKPQGVGDFRGRQNDFNKFNRFERGNTDNRNYEDNGNDGEQHKQKGICRSFQKGDCSYGDRCRFSHDLQGSDNYDGNANFDDDNQNQSNQPKGVCRSFQKGQCNYGDRCRYSHDQSGGNIGDDSSNFDGDNKKEQSQPKGICRSFQKGECNFGDRCKYSHDKPGSGDNEDNNYDGDNKKEQSQSKGICRNFQKGECNFGDRCKYSHDKPGSGDNEDDNPNQNRQEFNKGKGICRNFQRGACDYGDRCKYLHEKPDEMANQNEGTGGKKLCQFFLKGNCTYGDKCKFSHGSDKKDGSLPLNTAEAKDQDILKNQIFKFSIIELGKSNNLVNPKDIFSLGQRQLVAFFENGFLVLRMLTKKTKEKLELLKKLKQIRKNTTQMEEEQVQPNVHVSQNGLVLEVLNQFYYPIKKIIADRIFISAKRWVVVTFQNPLNSTYGFLAYDLLDCVKSKVTKCAAVNIAHSERITCAEYCLKNEALSEIEQIHNFTDQYKNFGTQNDLNQDLDPLQNIKEQKIQKQKLKTQKKQLLIMEYIIPLENEIGELDDKLKVNNADESIPEIEKEEISRKLKEEIEIKKKILIRYQGIYDQLTLEYNKGEEEEEEEKEDDDDDSDNQNDEILCGDDQNSDCNNEENQDQGNTEDIQQNSPQQYDQNHSVGNIDNYNDGGGDDDYDDDGDNDSNVEFYNEEEDLVEQIEDESDDAILLGDEENDTKRSDLADNFYFKTLILESQYANSLDDFILFTSSKDGYVKVWNISKTEEDTEKEQKDDNQYQQQQEIRSLLQGSQKPQNNLQNLNNEQQNQDNPYGEKKSQKLDSQFEYKAIIDKKLTLHITDDILNRQVICSIKQVTVIVKSITSEPNKLNRILLLGGEKGKLYSIGLNFSLSKISQVGSEQQRIDEFYISQQNQIFSILNSYENSQILQIGHDSSSLLDEVSRKIDSFYVNFDEQTKTMQIYYGNGNQLVMIKTKVPEKKIQISDEDLLEIELQKIENEIIAKEAENKKLQPEKQIQNKAEESNKDSQSNDKEDNKEENKIDIEEKPKQIEEKVQVQQYQTVLDFTQPYKIDLQNDEKLYSKELGFKEKIQRILEIKIKNQQVLFALVINENNKITQDCYLINFECKSTQRGSFRNKNQNQNDRSRSRSNLNFKNKDREDFTQRPRGDQTDNKKPAQFDGISKFLQGDNRRQQKPDNEGRNDRDNRNNNRDPSQNRMKKDNENQEEGRQQNNRPNNRQGFQQHQRSNNFQRNGNRDNRSQSNNQERGRGDTRDSSRFQTRSNNNRGQSNFNRNSGDQQFRGRNQQGGGRNQQNVRFQNPQGQRRGGDRGGAGGKSWNTDKVQQ